MCGLGWARETGLSRWLAQGPTRSGVTEVGLDEEKGEVVGLRRAKSGITSSC